jgi:hypothetical protein
VKADRLPAWKVRRLSPDEKAAVDRLRWYSPAPAERASLKRLLGWKRTHEETMALLAELLNRGMARSAIRDELGCTDRHLRRLLSEIDAEQVPEAENRTRKAFAGLEKTDITCESETGAHPLGPATRSRPPAQGFASVADLDRWLEENSL